MIIGHGDIANVLNDREGAIFFASGVSNSSCVDPRQFQIEIDLLSGLMGDKRSLFYFSTLNQHRKELYFKHKYAMEKYIESWFENYNIIRIGNIDWGKNPHTFLNAMRAKIHLGIPIEIRDEYKYMISKEQLLLLTDNLPLKGRNVISVFGRMAKVKDLL